MLDSIKKRLAYSKFWLGIKPLVTPFTNEISYYFKIRYLQNITPSGKFVLPTFIGIGAPQSGSTWLYENLKKHPQISMSNIKELHYFDRRFYRSLQSYSKNFDRNYQVVGEITPDYSVLKPKYIEFISRLIPDLKIVYILRNPVDIRFSSIRRILQKKGRQQFSEKDHDLIMSIIDDPHPAKGNYEKGLRRYDFAKILKNWQRFFPKEQMLLLYFDDLVAKPKEVLSKTFHFLGVDSEVDWSSFPIYEKINKNQPMDIPEFYIKYFEEKVNDDIEAAYRLLGEKAKNWRIIQDQ